MWKIILLTSVNVRQQSHMQCTKGDWERRSTKFEMLLFLFLYSETWILNRRQCVPLVVPTVYIPLHHIACSAHEVTLSQTPDLIKGLCVPHIQFGLLFPL